MVSRTSDIQDELERILDSHWLRESAQLKRLLRYTVEETLSGRQAGLKEYSLGLEVFHRPSDYDPHNDAIVRVQASLLRKRLAAYYENEGCGSALRIELPRGGYVPIFREVDLPPQPAPAKAPVPVEQSQTGGQWRLFWAGVAVGAVLACAAFLLTWSRQTRPPVPAPAVWGLFFAPGTETIVSFGVPLFYAGDGIFVRDTSVNTPNQQSQERLDKITQALGAPIRPQEDVYTGIGDLVGTHVVIHWLERQGVRTSLANSHYLGHSDIADKNLIVVSSVRFQTLLQEINLPSFFTFDSRPGGAFILADPVSGEQREYATRSGAGVDTSYSLLHLWPGRTAGLRILYLTGITTWATEGAARFAVNPAKLAELQARLDADPPQGPHGRKSPFFQVLLRVEGKNNQVRTVNYVTHRYSPPVPD